MLNFPPPCILYSLKDWRRDDLGRDLAAGLTLAAIAIPEQIATARLAGLPPEFGFFAFIAGTIGFALFGASRIVSVGGDSTIAPIFAGGLALLATAGTPAYPALAALLAFCTGAILVLAGLFRMGWVADLLSVPVTTGFLAGIAAHIVLSQAPALLGVAEGRGDFLQQLALLATRLPQTNCFALAVGAGVFALTLTGAMLAPRIPVALVALVLAGAATSIFHLGSHGLAVLGRVAGGLPHPVLPVLAMDDFLQLAELALLIAIVVMIQTAATARAFRRTGEGPPDIDRDFVGVGAAGMLAGLAGTFPVNASPPRTEIVAAAGGRTQLTGLVAVLPVALAAAWPGLTVHIPTAALAGLLLYIAVRITRFGLMAEIWRRTRGEFALVVVTAVAIVLLPIETGVAAGIFLSLLHGVWNATQTRVIEFARVKHTSIWWPQASGLSGKKLAGERLDGVLVLAFQAPLSFLNAHDFRGGFLAALGKNHPRLVVLEAGAIADIDFTAAQILAELIEHCHARDIAFAVARLESVRAQDAFARLGIAARLGPQHIFRSVQEAVDALAR